MPCGQYMAIFYLMQHAFVPEGFWKTLCQIFSQHDQEMKGLQMEMYLMFNQDVQLRCSIKMRGAAEVGRRHYRFCVRPQPAASLYNQI